MEKPTAKVAYRNDGDSADVWTGDITAARRVLALEADSLTQLGDSLGASFGRAVDAMVAVSGKVIVSGMGKSGHVGNKIAATLASTGTPAFALHPGEASHGDLGMVSADDLVLALSNSGETTELKDLIAFSKFRRIPLVAIVGRADATIAQLADVALILPPVPEACPLGLAPTTSSTMMLALGDALAVALMERRGFSPDQYGMLHPGGRLGKQFIKAEDLMEVGDRIPLVGPEMALPAAVSIMTDKHFGLVGVIDDDGRLVGVFTDGDLSRVLDQNILEARIGDVMTTTPKSIAPNALAADALGVMNENGISCIFVCADEKPVGVLHFHHILKAGIA